MTPGEQIKAILTEVEKLNRRKDAVYEELMESIAGYGVKLVDFRKIGNKASEYLEWYFDQ